MKTQDKLPGSMAFPTAVILTICCMIMASAGCESGEDAYSLTMEPAEAYLSSSSNTVVLTVSSNSVRELSLPLEWRVKYSSLGYVIPSAGYSATYVSYSSSGVNIVTAEDQYGAEGFTTIHQ